MKEFAKDEIKYPSTRYSGSKRRLLDWIYESTKNLKFNSVLDAFGGTASVGLMYKKYNKRVLYNDLLKFNQIIGKAVIENKDKTVSEEELDKILNKAPKGNSSFIQDNFSGFYFKNQENQWLDDVVGKINQVNDEYKRSIVFAALFQACLAKRPFNLFHRKNLYIRTAKVERTFGNKTTWETSFPVLLKRYVSEYNKAVFSNSKKNIVVGGKDVFDLNVKTDLVYLDPPYFSGKSSQGTNYLGFYHFLEGMAEYSLWKNKIDPVTKMIKPDNPTSLSAFTSKANILDTFSRLVQKFSDRIIVLSYQDDGLPSKEELISTFKQNGKNVKVYEKEHRYALSNKKSKELLFVAK